MFNVGVVRGKYAMRVDLVVLGIVIAFFMIQIFKAGQRSARSTQAPQ